MQLTGTMVKRLMRKHHVTIREIKAKYQISLKRIREVREKGVTGFCASEWTFIITGKWPDAT
jgi:hypothetical protein